MRILYLAPNIPVPGAHGGSTHVTSVTRALRRRGHEVLVLARRGSTEPGAIPIGLGNGAWIRHLLPSYYLPRILGPVARFGPDVIYERYSAYGLGVALAKIFDIPSVLMTLDRDASPISFRYADRIVATSSSFIPPRHRRKLREVRWGVDLMAFDGARGEGVRARLAPAGERLVVYTGSCASWHGLDVLVEVAVRWTGPPVVFVIVGEGEDLARLQRLARAMGVAERFAFEGRAPHEAIPAYVAAADVCVAPYAPARHPIFRQHGMDRDPIKLFEYMALGKPCVTIDTPRMRQLFEPGRDAAVYRAEDAGSLEAELLGLLAEPARAAAMGAAGKSLVERAYTWDRHAAELTDVFEEVLDERRQRRAIERARRAGPR